MARGGEQSPGAGGGGGGLVDVGLGDAGGALVEGGEGERRGAESAGGSGSVGTGQELNLEMETSPAPSESAVVGGGDDDPEEPGGEEERSDGEEAGRFVGSAAATPVVKAALEAEEGDDDGERTHEGAAEDVAGEVASLRDGFLGVAGQDDAEGLRSLGHSVAELAYLALVRLTRGEPALQAAAVVETHRSGAATRRDQRLPHALLRRERRRLLTAVTDPTRRHAQRTARLKLLSSHLHQDSAGKTLRREMVRVLRNGTA